MTNHAEQRSNAGLLQLFGATSLLGLAACSGGSSVSTPGGGSGPAGPALSVDFALRRDLLLGPAPVADALVLDWNGDGIQDLVQTAFLDQELVLSFGNPDGTFTPTFVLPTDGAAWRIAAGDLDGDGDLDLAVALVGAGAGGSGVAGIQGFLRDQDGGLVDGGTLEIGQGPFDVAILPVPGAADEVLLAVPSEGEVARVSFAAGAPVKVGALDSSVLGPGRPTSVAVLDVGGDGFPDVVVGELDTQGGEGSSLPDRVVVHRNDGSNFVPELLLAEAAFPIVRVVGDADGNGLDDLGVAQLDADDVVLFPNDPAGFLAPISVSFGGGTSSVLAGDLDGDGVLDLVATLFEQQSVSVRLASAPFTYEEPADYNVGPLPRAIALFDAPGDSAVDLLCASSEDLALLLGDGNGSFRAARGFRAGVQPILVQAEDLDGDGDVDIVALDHFHKQLGFLENLGDGTFQMVDVVPLEPIDEELPGSFVLSDVDGDGLVDVVVAIHELAEVRVIRNPGTIAGFSTAVVDTYSVGSELLGVWVSDVDGDGFPDAVVASSGPGEWALVVLLGSADGTLTPQPTIPVTAFRPAAVVGADLDGDGNVDLVVTGDNGLLPTGQEPVVAVFQGGGDGSFELAVQHDTTTLAHSIALGDLDEDGLLDAVLGQPGFADAFVVLRNVSGVGGLSFAVQEIVVGSAPGAVAIADLDNDGHLDVVTTTSAGELRIAYGAGDGTFPELEPATPGELAAPFGTFATVLADVDGDDLPDLVMAVPKGQHVWIGHNVSTPESTQP